MTLMGHLLDGQVTKTLPAAVVPEQRGAQLQVVPHPARGRIGRDVVPYVLAVDCIALGLASLVVHLSLLSAVLLAVFVLSLNAAGGLYRARLAPSILDELPGFLGRALVAGGIVTVFRLNLELPFHSGPVFAALVFVALATLGRAASLAVVRARRGHRPAGQPTLIVGCGNLGEQVGRTLLEHPEYGLTPVGYVDDALPVRSHAPLPAPVLGDTASLASLLTRHRVSHVIVAFARCRESELVGTLRTCNRLSCEIFFVPRFFELHGHDRETEFIWGIPLTRLRRPAHQAATWWIKRCVDLALAGLALILLSVVFALCAIAVRLEGGPGFIFRQERTGRDGRPFTMLKFRSLKPATESESSERWNIGADPRIGRVGRILRTLSLDELPQLWNVLRGDMSLVGPRPERPFFVEQFARRYPRYSARHRVPVGITGWAQIHGLRGDTDIGDRATFDNYYIENWSLWGDVKILLRTVGQVLGGGGS